MVKETVKSTIMKESTHNFIEVVKYPQCQYLLKIISNTQINFKNIKAEFLEPLK